MRWSEDVDVISIGNAYTTVTELNLDGEEERVNPNGKKLSSKSTALTSATTGDDGMRGSRGIIRPHIELGGRAIHGERPTPKAWKARGNDSEKITAVEGVESVADVEGSIDPRGVSSEDSLD